MSIALPTNKSEKRLRLTMLYKQGSITQKQAFSAYAEYCRLYDGGTDNIVEDIKELSKGYLTD